MLVPRLSIFWSVSTVPVVVRFFVSVYLLYLCVGVVLVSRLSAPWSASVFAVPVPVPELSAPLFAACFLIF